jgi:hypothetical protein
MGGRLQSECPADIIGIRTKIEAELSNEKMEPGEEERLRQRAEMIRGLLAPGPIT